MRFVFIFAAALSLLLAAPPQQPKRPTPKAKRTAPRPKPDPPAAPKVFPIESIAVTGSKRYPADALVKLAGLTPSQPADEKLFEAARDRLLAHGALASVGYRYAPAPSGRGYAVTFEVTDFEQLLPYRFYGFSAGEESLRSHLRSVDPLFTDRIPANDVVIARYRAALSERLSRPDAPVVIDSKITADQPGDLHILFYPRGSLLAIAEVRFTGNTVLPTATLQNAIHGVAIGAEYREGRFQELLNTSIRPLYEARGRIRVQFPKITTAAPAGDVRGLSLTVEVDEGPSFSFGEIGVRIDSQPAPELLKAADLQPGDLANMQLALQAQQRIHQAMQRSGYMRVTSRIERNVNDRTKTLDLTFHVTPGPRFTFGKLATQGLDLHGEHEVKRIWTMKPGQPFNSEYPDFFLNRLKEDGVFDNLQSARAVLTPNDRDLTVDVLLIFNERRPEVMKPKPLR